VFGRESKGLSSEELERCTVQCEIPVAGNMSLNLAQAVSVGLYELCRAGLLSDASGLARRNRLRNPAKIVGTGHAEWEALVQYLSTHLAENHRGQPWSETAIRKWLHRLAPDSLELRALFGIVRTLAGDKARAEKKAHL
jgi:tRNA/rRNA methyltransferase/tRNA (cytidine32/uridine32-2'-O)-methyltransferase